MSTVFVAGMFWSRLQQITWTDWSLQGAKLQTSADHEDRLEFVAFVLELAPGGGEIDIRLLF